MISREEVHEINKLAISAIAEVRLFRLGSKYRCPWCKENTVLYCGNRKDLLDPRCRKCNLKRVINIRFYNGSGGSDKTFKNIISDLTKADDESLVT